MRTCTQKLCAYSGIVGILVFFAGLLCAGFIPPPGPELSATEVAEIYRANTDAIRLGGVLIMTGGMFMAPQIAILRQQLSRIEPGAPLLSNAQAYIGTMGILFFMLPGLIFVVTAYRPERSAELTMLMNDFGWITTFIGWPPAFMQCFLIAVIILQDRSPRPLFPRWLGYFNLWIGLTFFPASYLAFVRNGPFAWNGLFSFWIPGSLFGIWCIVTMRMLLRAIGQEDHPARK